MRNFDTLANLLWEGLKNPKDNPCWKGYKPVGTKKKNGRTVPNCVPKESKKKLTENYKISGSFTELPDSPPHGFWVTKDGKFIVVPYMWGHDEAIKTLYPEIGQGAEGSNLQLKALKAGLLRMAKLGSSGTYGLTYHPLHTGAAAKKTARDIASFYNMGVQDDFEGY